MYNDFKFIVIERFFTFKNTAFTRGRYFFYLGIYKNIIKAYNNGNNPGGKNNGESNYQGNNKVFQEAQGDAAVC